jgi:hypothetical protein
MRVLLIVSVSHRHFLKASAFRVAAGPVLALSFSGPVV